MRTSRPSYDRAWHAQFRDLLHDRNIAGAVTLARAQAESGDPLALLELAIIGEPANLTTDESNEIVERIDREADDDDAELHFGLYRAYQLMLGTCESERMAHRGFSHLIACAECSTNPVDSYAVASIFEWGSLATIPSAAEALKWYIRAGALGHPDAADKIKRLRK